MGTYSALTLPKKGLQFGSIRLDRFEQTMK